MGIFPAFSSTPFPACGHDVVAGCESESGDPAPFSPDELVIGEGSSPLRDVTLLQGGDITSSRGVTSSSVSFFCLSSFRAALCLVSFSWGGGTGGGGDEQIVWSFALSTYMQTTTRTNEDVPFVVSGQPLVHSSFL